MSASGADWPPVEPSASAQPNPTVARPVEAGAAPPANVATVAAAGAAATAPGDARQGVSSGVGRQHVQAGERETASGSGQPSARVAGRSPRADVAAAAADVDRLSLASSASSSGLGALPDIEVAGGALDPTHALASLQQQQQPADGDGRRSQAAAAASAAVTSSTNVVRTARMEVSDGAARNLLSCRSISVPASFGSYAAGHVPVVNRDSTAADKTNSDTGTAAAAAPQAGAAAVAASSPNSFAPLQLMPRAAAVAAAAAAADGSPSTVHHHYTAPQPATTATASGGSGGGATYAGAGRSHSARIAERPPPPLLPPSPQRTSSCVSSTGSDGSGVTMATEESGEGCLVVVDSHFDKAFKVLDWLYKSWELCDVVLEVDGCEIRSHRVVLAAASPYFQAMFTIQMQESRQERVVLTGMPAQSVQALVDFAYTGEIRVGESNVQQLLPAACLLQMPSVVDGCCAFLRQQLDCSNCLGIARFADLHGCPELARYAERFAREHYSLIVTRWADEFLALTCEQYRELLSSTELNALSEEAILTDVFRWLRHDPDSRQQHLHRVLAKVRLVLIPPPALVRLGGEAEVRACERCRDLVDEAKNYLLVPEEPGRIAAELTQPRQPLRNAVLYAVGGWCTGEALAGVERYDWPNDEWVCVARMSKKRCGVGLAAVGAFLYALGGHDGIHYLNSIEKYDPRTNAWSACPVSPSCEVRTSVGIGVIGEFIFAVGGQDGISCLDTAECYNTKSGEWSRKAPMSERRLGVAVVVLDGLLYAIGGADGGIIPMCTAERYDPRADRWQPIASMLTKRKHHGAAALNGHIYVAGGRDEHAELNSVECYSCHGNKWSHVGVMTSYRSGVGLSVVRGRIYAVGGFNGSTYLRSAECYNEELDEWTEVASMNNRRLGGGVAVIEAAYSAPAPSPKFKPMPGFS